MSLMQLLDQIVDQQFIISDTYEAIAGVLNSEATEISQRLRDVGAPDETIGELAAQLTQGEREPIVGFYQRIDERTRNLVRYLGNPEYREYYEMRMRDRREWQSHRETNRKLEAGGIHIQYNDRS